MGEKVAASGPLIGYKWPSLASAFFVMGELMQNHDIFYRVAGALMLLSSLWNMVMSAIWFFSLIWVCVGVFWLVPGLLAVVYAGVGIYMLATGAQVKPIAFAPAIGLLISLMNFNFLGMAIDVVALIMGVVGYTQAPQIEDQQQF